jgi:type VI secretion system secreted protein Hcp
MGLYLQYEGVKGDASEGQHKEWIQCDSLSFSASRPASTSMGAGSQRQGQGVTIGEVAISKKMDASSPQMFKASVLGNGKKATIHATRPGDKGQVKYLEIVLHDTFITTHQTMTDGVNHSELLTLNFVKIDMKFIAVDAKGQEKPMPVSFDAAASAAASPAA